MAIRTIAQAAFSLSLASLGPLLASETLAAPAGLKPCSLGDPVAAVEARLATRLGGDFIGCFRSDTTIAATNSAQQIPTPLEYAFALALHDRNYSPADLHQLLSRVEQQWKDFEPLDGKLSDAYVAKLNEVINGKHKADDTSVQSIRPVLVKIDGEHGSYYTVTSIRTYVVTTGDASVTATKVNADAVVVRNSRLVRLTIQRTLTDAADVTRVQADIDRWARSIA